MPKSLVTNANPETVLRVLAKLDVVRDDGAPGPGKTVTQVIVGIGMQMNLTSADGERRPVADL